MKQIPINRYSLPGSLVLAGIVTVILLGCGGDDTSVTPTPLSDPVFRQVTNLPTVTTWERVWGVSASDLFVMGEDGYVYRGDGSTWTEELSTVNDERVMYSAWGATADNMFFVGRIIYGDTVEIPDPDGGVPDTVIQDSPILDHYNGTIFNAVGLTGVDWGLYDIWGSAADDIFAVGYDGTIIHYEEIGSDWTIMSAGGETPVWLTAVWGTSDSSVYASGRKGTLLHYDGAAWSVIVTHTAEHIWDVWGLSDTLVYGVGSNGMVLRYDGSSISLMSTPVNSTLYSIWGSSEDDLYAVGYSGTIIHYDGTEWTEVPSGTGFALSSLWGTDANNIYASGQTLLRYDGNNWNPVVVRNEPDFADVWAGSDGISSEAIAVGTGGNILKSDGGNLFGAMTVGGGSISTNLNGVGGNPEGEALFIVGDGGTILERDTETNWVDASPGTSGDLFAVAVLSDSLAYAVGAGGTLLEYDGNAWSVIQIMSVLDFNDVWIGESAGDTTVHIVCDSGFTLYHDGSWQSTASNTTENLQSVFGIGAGEAYAVGDNGTLLHFTNGAWSVMSSGTFENLTSVWVDDSDNVFVCGESGRVFQLVSGSLTDIETDIGFDLNGIYGLSSTNIFVVGDFNHIIQYSR